MLRYYSVVNIFVGLICVFACASPKSPTGGAKDETPPAIVESESTPNKQTNFNEREIILTFDEWVTVKDIFSQLVVSPLMPQDPEIKQKGKGIVITLPDSLKEQTTYTINFGNAIADLNEGNVLENYAFVFSTGDVLDSITLSGTVINALTLKPAEGAWVMFYPVGEDSAVYKHKPEYLSKTNKEGKWSISNVRADSFMVVALKDENLNFLYDQESELIGWLDEVIYSTQESPELPEISIFPREQRLGVREIIHTTPGWMKIIVDAPFPKPVPDFLPAIDNSIKIWDGDTLHVWYTSVENYRGHALLGGDSTQVRLSQAQSIKNQKANVKVTSGRLFPGGSATFISEVPIIVMDTSKIVVRHDSLGVLRVRVAIDTSDSRRFRVYAPWLAEKRYNLIFMPGAIRDYFGRSNDTIKSSIVVSGVDQYGDLTISFEGLDSTKQYLLFLKEGDQVRETFIIRDQQKGQIIKKGLLPGKYIIELIEDLNQNGKWDTGRYDLRRQPERKQIFVPEDLRAGWELEAKILWE